MGRLRSRTLTGLQSPNARMPPHVVGFLRGREGQRVLIGAAVRHGRVRHAALPPPGPCSEHRDPGFNTWAATFDQVVEEMELSVAGGDRFKLKSRFAKFQNVPELLKMFHTFADVKTAEDLKLPVPDLRPTGRGGAGCASPTCWLWSPAPSCANTSRTSASAWTRSSNVSWTPRKTTCSQSPQTAAKPPWT